MSKKILKRKEKTTTERAKDYLKENEYLLSKHKLIMWPVINFPAKRKVPRLSKIAIWIITKQKGVTDFQFGDFKK